MLKTALKNVKKFKLDRGKMVFVCLIYQSGVLLPVSFYKGGVLQADVFWLMNML